MQQEAPTPNNIFNAVMDSDSGVGVIELLQSRYSATAEQAETWLEHYLLMRSEYDALSIMQVEAMTEPTQGALG